MKTVHTGRKYFEFIFAITPLYRMYIFKKTKMIFPTLIKKTTKFLEIGRRIDISLRKTYNGKSAQEKAYNIINLVKCKLKPLHTNLTFKGR